MFTTVDLDDPTKRKTEREIVLEPLENKIPKDSKGRTDNRIEMTHLKAIMDSQTCLWTFKYDTGITPEALRQKFTNFRTAVTFLEQYVKSRNFRIKEIKD